MKKRMIVSLKALAVIYLAGTLCSLRLNPLDWMVFGQVIAVSVFVLLMVVIHGYPKDSV